MVAYSDEEEDEGREDHHVGDRRSDMHEVVVVSPVVDLCLSEGYLVDVDV